MRGKNVEVTGITAVVKSKFAAAFLRHKGKEVFTMKKRGLSVLLCALMLLSMLHFTVYADANEITAYITISRYGNIVEDRNGNPVAEAPIVLTGKESYTLDDAFSAAHELYYEGGASAGYATADSEWGLSVTKVWGDTSGKYGYQLNFGAVSVLGPTQTIADGDYIDLCVYENYYPNTESYSKFNAGSKTVVNGEAELTLYESYYGENWETLFRPCAGVTIYVDGEATEVVTDSNGKCTVEFGEFGQYIISAKKTKVLRDEIEETESVVTAITAPICIVTYAEGITAFITISVNGDIVTDKNGSFVAEAPIVLTGKESYTLDDAFSAAHELYYEGGAAAGYATADSEWGLSVTKVWGDTSGKFGYQMNLGAVDVWGPTQAVSDGDYIDLCVYESYYPNTESYAKFDSYSKTVVNGEAELTLYESYYGENWETLYRPCAGATIHVDGEATEFVTDANGSCTVEFEEYGKYLISAKKTKVLIDEIEETESTVTAITAPVCLVTAAPMAVECRYMLNITIGNEIDLEHSQVSVAGYRGGKLIDMVTDIAWSGNTATVSMNKAATDIKLFVWKSLEGQEPILETEVINLK